MRCHLDAASCKRLAAARRRRLGRRRSRRRGAVAKPSVARVARCLHRYGLVAVIVVEPAALAARVEIPEIDTERRTIERQWLDASMWTRCPPMQNEIELPA